jgi:hypothetical protein
MTAAATELSARAPRPRATQALLEPFNLLVLLAATALAVFFALIVHDSTIFDGAYLPRGNDSLYHARRILDAAIGSRGFYQFDDCLHAPDGSWITWPWAYDYLVAKATQVALWVVPGLDPMAFISYVPVAWLAVNAALFLAALTALGLSRDLRLLAMLCFALSPLTQLLHSIGMIDHHYVEHTFVLLTAWLGLRWFARPDDVRSAVALGIALGAAPAFHNGLFMLQLVPLATVFVLWLRGSAGPAGALRGFNIALLATTQLALLPSAPYWNGLFEFGLLSWFHFYVAVCTAVALTLMSTRRFSRANLLLLGGACALLAAPLGAQVLAGAGFLSGEFSILGDIIEVQSPWRMLTETFGFRETLSFYTWLLFLAPPLLLFHAVRVFRERDPHRLYFSVLAVFGLALFLSQFRLHYFGFFALVAGTLLIIDDLRRRNAWHAPLVFVSSFAFVALTYQPALRERLFIVYAPGADTEYARALTTFLDLGRLCAQDPGVVLASPDDGSAILFHSECSVIANNFILREDDKVHIEEVKRLMLLSPGEIRAERPDVKYMLVRIRDFSVLEGDTAYVVDENRVAKQLLLDDQPPEGYSLVRTVSWSPDGDGIERVYAKLYKLSPPVTVKESPTALGP